MNARKLQIIGGKTYAVTLPKNWVKEANITPKDVIFIEEKDSETLILKTSSSKEKEIDQVFLNTDNYKDNLAQAVFVSYYLGIETIIIYSKKGFDTKTKNMLKKAISQMSGTEIIYEDKNKIKIKTLLDHTKITINQIFFRISLIISELTDNLINSDFDTIENNENEIDRLYNLANKIILHSTKNYGIKRDESIKTPSLALPYFLIAKKLENIGDELYSIANIVKKEKGLIPKIKEPVTILREDIKIKVNHLITNKKTAILKDTAIQSGTLKDKISNIENIGLRIHFDRILKAINDIETEIINISFYEELMKKSVI